MTMHFFQTELTSEQRARLEAVFGERAVASRRMFDSTGDEGHLTPAVIEQLCGEYDTVDEFLASLEEMPDTLRQQAQKTQKHA